MDAHDTKLPEAPAVEDGHEVKPVPGTAYTTAGANTGRQVNPMVHNHFPAEAICAGTDDTPCGQVIYITSFFGAWHHAGRMPGETP